jgi:allophanate hydrolase subunit 1
MFNAEKQPHMPVTVGDRVQFEPIDEQQYLAMGGLLHEL